MTSSPTRRLSGLQRQVLSLYRDCLRCIRHKEPHTRDNWRRFTRREFDKYRDSVSPRDINAVEALLRAGRKRLETMQHPSVKNVS
ncbi:hypothetical protein RI367_000689 [Sorochytrium milnesiophthora]